MDRISRRDVLAAIGGAAASLALALPGTALAAEPTPQKGQVLAYTSLFFDEDVYDYQGRKKGRELCLSVPVGASLLRDPDFEVRAYTAAKAATTLDLMRQMLVPPTAPLCAGVSTRILHSLAPGVDVSRLERSGADAIEQQDVMRRALAPLQRRNSRLFAFCRSCHHPIWADAGRCQTCNAIQPWVEWSRKSPYSFPVNGPMQHIYRLHV